MNLECSHYKQLHFKNKTKQTNKKILLLFKSKKNSFAKLPLLSLLPFNWSWQCQCQSISHAWLFYSMDYNPPGSSSMGFSRQVYWGGLPFPSPGDLSNPGIKPMSLMSPALTGGFFTTSATCKAPQRVLQVSIRAFIVAKLLTLVWLSVTPWTAALQASLSFTISLSLLKLMSIESVMPPNHLVLCCFLLFLPSIFPSIRVFYNESALPIRSTNYWNFSFSISPSNEY